jgi:drug/metabolite transporter (DMT)-like permease
VPPASRGRSARDLGVGGRQRSGPDAADVGLLLVAIGAIGFGCRPLFARLAFDDDVTPALAGLLTLAPTALLCLPSTISFLGRAGENVGGRTSAIWALAAGVFVAIGSLTYMQALESLPVATATVVYFSYPLFVVLLGWLIGGTRPTPAMLAAAALITVGCVAIVAPGATSGARPSALLIAFAAPFSYAILLLLLAQRLALVPLFPRLGLITLGATLVLMPTAGIGGFPALGAVGRGGWIGVAGLIVVCGFIPQLTTTVGVPRAGPDRAAIAGGLELVTALAAGWLALGEPMAPREVAGALAIGMAVLLAQRSRT